MKQDTLQKIFDFSAAAENYRQEADPIRWLLSLPAELDDYSPIERAIFGGALAGRVAHATVAGHQAAIRQLLSGAPTDGACPGIVAFCASEENGAHPRHIKTALTLDDAGGKATRLPGLPATTSSGGRLNGRKQWATLAPRADQLLIVASAGQDAEHNDLRLVQVPAGRAGIDIQAMDKTRFLPEISHGVVVLNDVRVEPGEVLPGDGYLDAVKPFRTLEDLFIPAALLAYTLGVGRRCGWPPEAVEETLYLTTTALALAQQPPSSPALHVGLGGWLRAIADSRRRQEPLWQQVETEERERFRRDTQHQIAGTARERRLSGAWRTLDSREQES